jgi:hypothetical protein
MDDMQRILSRGKQNSEGSTELLFQFQSATAARLAGFLNRDTPEANGKVHALNAAMGGDYWQSHIQALGNNEQPIRDALVKMFADRIAERGGFETIVCPIPLDAGAKYHLVFGSRHPDAIPIMNEVINGLVEESYHRRPAGPLLQGMPDWEKEQYAETQASSLTSRLKEEYGLSGLVFDLEDIYKRGARRHFAAFRRTHYRRAADMLLAEGVIRIADGNPLTWKSRVEFIS